MYEPLRANQRYEYEPLFELIKARCTNHYELIKATSTSRYELYIKGRRSYRVRELRASAAFCFRWKKRSRNPSRIYPTDIHRISGTGRVWFWDLCYWHHYVIIFFATQNPKTLNGSAVRVIACPDIRWNLQTFQFENLRKFVFFPESLLSLFFSGFKNKVKSSGKVSCQVLSSEYNELKTYNPDGGYPLYTHQVSAVYPQDIWRMEKTSGAGYPLSGLWVFPFEMLGALALICGKHASYVKSSSRGQG